MTEEAAATAVKAVTSCETEAIGRTSRSRLTELARGIMSACWPLRVMLLSNKSLCRSDSFSCTSARCADASTTSTAVHISATAPALAGTADCSEAP